MPIKGFAPVGTSNAPSVRVVFQKPREDNPFSSVKDKKKQERIKRELSGLWWLGGLFAGVWILNNMKPGGGSLGDLRRVGKAANMNGFTQAPESAAATDGAWSHFTVGDTARFKVDEGNADKVQAVLRSFLDEAVAGPYMTDAAAEVLRRGNTDFGGDELTKATILHDFVNNQMGVIPDPQGFENVVSPDELMARWFEVEAAGGNPKEVGEDCDSKALLLCTLYLVSGIGAQVVLYDVNGDTYLDHAAVVATIDGQEVYAETVAPGMPLGEAPEILGTTTLTV